MSEYKVVGVDIGGTSIEAGLVEGKQLIETHSLPTHAQRPANEILQTLIDGIEKVKTTDTKAIGIGVPGLLNPDKGEILNINNIPSWKNFPLKQKLEEHFSLPVYVNNDANCFALGTKHFGKGLAYQNFMAIVLGTGVGGGIICNNKLTSGHLCGAGEVGCLPYLDGIFEDYSGSRFFTNHYNTSGKELALQANQGNQLALKAFHELGIHIGKLINNLLYVLAPEAIILGGSVSQSFSFFEAGIKEAVDEFPFKSISENLTVTADNIEKVAILGAAGLFYNEEE